MKVAYPRLLLFVAGLLLLGWALLPAQPAPTLAAPLLVETGTTTTEPPTPTNTSTPSATATVPTATSTATATAPASSVTATATAPASSVTATATAPPPDETDEPGEPTATAEPTATPLLSPTPVPLSDPLITKTVDRASVRVGDTVEFVLTVTNRGSAPAADVVVEDSLPSFLALEGVSATRGEVSVSGSTVRVVIGTLAPGETVVIRISARVTAAATPPNNINTGTVTTSSPGDDPSNNSSQVTLITEAPAPSPTAAAPARLPNTGTPGDLGSLPLIGLGLALIALSLLLRARQRS